VSLPHAFPCRFAGPVEARAAGRATVRWSAADWWLRGAAAAPIALLVEAAAQAAAGLLLPESPIEAGPLDVETLRLAGVDDARVDALPLPGESWEVEARIERRLGRLTRVEARFFAGGREAGRATLVLTS
jgi:hypothetical protein